MCYLRQVSFHVKNVKQNRHQIPYSNIPEGTYEAGKKESSIPTLQLCEEADTEAASSHSMNCPTQIRLSYHIHTSSTQAWSYRTPEKWTYFLFEHTYKIRYAAPLKLP